MNLKVILYSIFHNLELPYIIKAYKGSHNPIFKTKYTYNAKHSYNAKQIGTTQLEIVTLS